VEAEDALAFCWAFARMGMLDEVMVTELSRAVALRDERRAANVTQQLDADGWQPLSKVLYISAVYRQYTDFREFLSRQLHPNSLFDDDARAPPPWATVEYVHRLIRHAMASNRRQMQREGHAPAMLALSKADHMYACVHAGYTMRCARACEEISGNCSLSARNVAYVRETLMDAFSVHVWRYPKPSTIADERYIRMRADALSMRACTYASMFACMHGEMQGSMHARIDSYCRSFFLL
jgi:hypothetical protein